MFAYISCEGADGKNWPGIEKFESCCGDWEVWLRVDDDDDDDKNWSAEEKFGTSWGVQ